MADYDRGRYGARSRDDDRERGRFEDDERRFGRSSDIDRGRYDREDDDFIARRGFGNETSGYTRGYDDRYGRGRERDFGDSAGYGTGGSTRDWRDVEGERDYRSPWMATDDDRLRERGYAGGHGAGPRNRSFGASGRDWAAGSNREPGSDERGFLERAGDTVASWFGAETGPHRGRGPKGYRRSDQRIQDDVSDRLTDDPHVDASEIEVSVSSGEVTLSGTVQTRFEKRHAEDLAETVSGVTHVQNNLRVQVQASAGTTHLETGARGDATGTAGVVGGTDRSIGGTQSSASRATGRRSRSPSASGT